MVAIKIEGRADRLPVRLEEAERVRIVRDSLEMEGGGIQDQLFRLDSMRQELGRIYGLTGGALAGLKNDSVQFLQRDLDKAEGTLAQLARLHLNAEAEKRIDAFREESFEVVSDRVMDIQLTKLEGAACLNEAESRLLRLMHQVDREHAELSRRASDFARSHRFAQRVEAAARGIERLLNRPINAEILGETVGLTLREAADKAIEQLGDLAQEAREYLWPAELAELQTASVDRRPPGRG